MTFKEQIQQEVENWEGKVKEVEFRGPLTRVYGELDSREPICVDIASEKVTNLKLRPEDRIFFHIPKSGIIRYPGNEVV